MPTFDFQLRDLVSTIEIIAYWEARFEKPPPKNALVDFVVEPAVPDDEVKLQRQALGLLRATCQRIESDAALDRLHRLELALNHPPLLSHSKAHQLWQALHEAIVDDLQRCHAQYIPRRQAALYANIDRDWLEAFAKFDATKGDVSHAIQCYALGQSTACVFYLMRALEVVVKRLANRLGMSISTQTTWRQLTGSMSGKISPMPESTPRQKARKEKWMDAAASLHHVGQAWRNTTMHPARTYTPEEAYAVIEATRTFMTTCSRL